MCETDSRAARRLSWRTTSTNTQAYTNKDKTNTQVIYIHIWLCTSQAQGWVNNEYAWFPSAKSRARTKLHNYYSRSRIFSYRRSSARTWCARYVSVGDDTCQPNRVSLQVVYVAAAGLRTNLKKIVKTVKHAEYSILDKLFRVRAPKRKCLRLSENMLCAYVWHSCVHIIMIQSSAFGGSVLLVTGASAWGQLSMSRNITTCVCWTNF